MSVDDFLKTKNRVIIVLDDVFTTGASLSEARRALFGSWRQTRYWDFYSALGKKSQLLGIF